MLPGLFPQRETTDLNAHDLQSAIMRLSRRIRQNSADERATETQTAVLIHVLRHGPRTPGELSAFQRVSAPSMNRTVNALVENGFAERAPAPEDRRSVLVVLTDAGRELAEQTLSRRDAWLDLVVARLDPDERELLAEALPILRKLTEP